MVFIYKREGLSGWYQCVPVLSTMSVEGLVGVECGAGDGAEVWPAGVAIEGWSTVVEPTQCNPQVRFYT